jgi:hypothetical protein
MPNTAQPCRFVSKKAAALITKITIAQKSISTSSG